MTDVQILDDWDTIGVRGSGSSSVTVRDVFVPDVRIVRADSAQFGKYKSTQLDREWLYRASFSALGQINALREGQMDQSFPFRNTALAWTMPMGEGT